MSLKQTITGVIVAGAMPLSGYAGSGSPSQHEGAELYLFGADVGVGWMYDDLGDRPTMVDTSTIRLCVDGSPPLTIEHVSFEDAENLRVTDFSVVTWDQAFEAVKGQRDFPVGGQEASL